MKTIKIGDYKFETELHKDMNRASLIKIPKGWELITFDDLMNLWNNHRKEFDFGENGFDEIVKQPLKEKEIEYPFWNVWFGIPQVGSSLNCRGRDLNSDGRAFGVRFKRKVRK